MIFGQEINKGMQLLGNVIYDGSKTYNAKEILSLVQNKSEDLDDSEHYDLLIVLRFCVSNKIKDSLKRKFAERIFAITQTDPLDDKCIEHLIGYKDQPQDMHAAYDTAYSMWDYYWWKGHYENGQSHERRAKMKALQVKIIEDILTKEAAT